MASRRLLCQRSIAPAAAACATAVLTAGARPNEREVISLTVDNTKISEGDHDGRSLASSECRHLYRPLVSAAACESPRGGGIGGAGRGDENQGTSRRRDGIFGNYLRRRFSDSPSSGGGDYDEEPMIKKAGKVAGAAQISDDGASPPGHLSREEERLVCTFDRAAPSVAHIQTTAVVRPHPFALQAMEVPAGTGSGIVWDYQGHVVTNYHVIAAAYGGGLDDYHYHHHGRGGESLSGQRVLVKCQGMAEPLDAQVVGVDPEKDIAVLKITSPDEPGSGGASSPTLPRPIDVGSSSSLRVGQTVLAIGNPFGLDNTLTTGVVSALGRDVQGFTGRPIRGCVQTDAAINPGNSGGPVLDSSGRLVGVSVAIVSPAGQGGGNVGIGFAIPVDTVKRVVDQIVKHGRVVRPTLGVNVADDRIAASIGMQLGWGRLEGAMVVEVLPESPAEKAGMVPTTVRRDGALVLGDLIVEVDGRRVREVEDLLMAVEERRDGGEREAGEEVKIRVFRGCDPSREETLTAVLHVEDGGGRASRRGFGGRTSMVQGRPQA